MSNCKGCRYGFYSGMDNIIGCQYLLHKHEKRGCPARDGCTRFESIDGKPRNMIRREERKMKKLSEENKREIISLRDSGMKVNQIAHRFNVDKSSVYNVLKDYKEHGESCFGNKAPTFEEMHDASMDYDEEAHRYEVTADTDIEAYMVDRNKKEPETAATETGSEQEICEDIPADIVTPSEENVKPVIPQAVIEACWGRKAELEEQIAQEQAVIDDWKRQIAEIDDFLGGVQFEN